MYKQTERDVKRAQEIIDEKNGLETSTKMVWINYRLAVVQREVYEILKKLENYVNQSWTWEECYFHISMVIKQDM